MPARRRRADRARRARAPASRRRGARSARARRRARRRAGLDRLGTSLALPIATPSGWSMSVSRRAPRRPSRAAERRRASARASARAAARGQERAAADLDVHHERVGALGDLLREDRRRDERDRLDGRGGVAQRVEQRDRRAPGARSARRARSRPARARAGTRGRLERGAKAGDRLQLVERAAGVAERAPRHHRDVAAPHAAHERREAERDLVAHAAGRVLVDGAARAAPTSRRRSPESIIARVQVDELARGRGRARRSPSAAPPADSRESCRGRRRR